MATPLERPDAPGQPLGRDGEFLKLWSGQAISLLGFEQKFVQRGTFPLGPGDMQRPADFGIYQIAANGNYVRVA